MISTDSKNDFLPAPVRVVLPYFVLALCVFAAYGNIFDNAFVFDDDLLIQMNSYLRSWSHVWDILRGSTTSGAYISGGFYRPMQILLYLIVFQLGNGKVFLFHVLNLGLHIVNVCLVYRLGTKLKFNAWSVFLASLVWGVHTLHTEAVTYMSATADPLFAFFCLLTIIILLPDITQRKIIQIIPLFLLGLVSKETTVMLPLLVMACLFLTNPNRLDFRAYIRTWPLWVITLAFTAWRMNADFLDGPKTFQHLYGLHNFANLKMYADNPLYRAYTFFATLPVYLKLLVWPTGLHMERAFSIYTTPWCKPVMMGIGLFVLAAAQIGYCCFKGSYARYRERWIPASQVARIITLIGRFFRNGNGTDSCIILSWGLLWFAAAHAPDSGLLVQMNALFLEHWMYLPAVGLFLAIGETVTRLLHNRAKIFAVTASLCVVIFAGFLAAKTYAQNEIWFDPPRFYNNIFSYGEQSARAHNNLALYYAGQGDYENSIIQFKQAIAISDSYAETRHNLALIYLRMDERGHVQDAIDNLNRAIEIDPNFYRSYQTLGEVYGNVLNDPKQAAVYKAKGAELKKLRE